MLVVGPVEHHLLDVAALALTLNRDVPAILQMDGRLLEVGGADDVLVTAWADGVESQGGEDVPGRCLAVVLVAAVAVRTVGIEAVHHLADPVLRLPGLAAVAIEVDHVLDRLVAVGIVAHVHDLHLADLVDGEAVVTVVEDGGQAEYRVHHLVELSLAAHQVDQSLWVVEHAPGVVPTVALREGIAPFQGVERLCELPVLQSASHQFRLRVEQVLVVHRPLGVDADLLLRLAEGLAQLVDAPVVVGIFERTGGVLVDLHVVGHVAQSVVVFVAQSARGTHFGVNGLRTVHHGLPQRLHVVASQSLQPGVGHDRGRIVAHHAATMAGAGPFRQEPAFQIGVHQSLLHLHVHRRIYQVQQREQTAERVPEARVGEHVALPHFPVVGAVVYGFALRVDLVETAGEEHRTIETTVERAQMVDVAVLDVDAAQHLVPALPALRLHLLQPVAADLLQVLLGLLQADER